ncbi:MAG: DinB family protein [Pyrinomonadaceae bacterium]|nr:DinB family protein [Pyrinomonadaceae bacterium]
MANEAWLNGKLDGFAPVVMPAAHALVQSIVDLERFAAILNQAELTARPNNSPSAAFHLRHLAGSLDRLLTYVGGEELNQTQFDFLKAETAGDEHSNAAELTQKAIAEINNALEKLKTVPPESLFEERFVGRQKLSTNVFGLLFHIAEHTARHVGQIITITKIVRTEKIN